MDACKEDFAWARMHRWYGQAWTDILETFIRIDINSDLRLLSVGYERAFSDLIYLFQNRDDNCVPKDYHGSRKYARRVGLKADARCGIPSETTEERRRISQLIRSPQIISETESAENLLSAGVMTSTSEVMAEVKSSDPAIMPADMSEVMRSNPQVVEGVIAIMNSTPDVFAEIMGEIMKLRPSVVPEVDPTVTVGIMPAVMPAIMPAVTPAFMPAIMTEVIPAIMPAIMPEGRNAIMEEVKNESLAFLSEAYMTDDEDEDVEILMPPPLPVPTTLPPLPNVDLLPPPLPMEVGNDLSILPTVEIVIPENVANNLLENAMNPIVLPHFQN
jgi:hypothetical protein